MKVGQPSLSIPGWSVIGTGAWQERSGVTTNWYKGAVKVDSIFAQARKSGLTTALVGSADWRQLYGTSLGVRPRSSPCRPMPTRMWRRWALQDDAALEAALAILQSEKPSLLLLAFAGADEAGHGYGGASPVYAQVVEGIDKRIARLVERLDLSRTTLIVTADHGTIDTGGHGGWEDSVLRVPFVAVGKAVRPGAYADAEQTDLAPTVAVLLGTAIPTHSQGRGLLDLLDMPDKARAERAYDVAKQLAEVHALYAQQIGAPPLDHKRLLTADVPCPGATMPRPTALPASSAWRSAARPTPPASPASPRRGRRACRWWPCCSCPSVSGPWSSSPRATPSALP